MVNLKKLYQLYVQGMVDADTELLGQYLTDNFYLVQMSGMKQSKEDWFAAIDDGSMAYHSAVSDSVQVINEHEVVGRTQVTASIWGTSGTWKLESHLYCQQVDGQWLIDHIVTQPY